MSSTPSRSPLEPGRLGPEPVDSLARNSWTASLGTGGRLRRNTQAGGAVSQGLPQPGSPAQTSVPSADSVSELLHHLDDARRARNKDCVRLLQELTPHLHAARAVERELDRYLARRFNIFRYLRDDELGITGRLEDPPVKQPAAQGGGGEGLPGSVRHGRRPQLTANRNQLSPRCRGPCRSRRAVRPIPPSASASARPPLDREGVVRGT